MLSANFINQPVKLTPELIKDGYQCFCMDETKEKDYYIIHDGKDGDKHPFHLSCVKEWIAKNNVCPSCRAPISNTLTSKSEKIVNFTKTSGNGALLGMQGIAGDLLYGTATAAAIGGLSLAGLGGTQDALAILGYICVPLAGAGIYGMLSGPVPGAEERIFPLAIGAASMGTLLGIVSFAFGQTRDAKAVQIAGAIALLHSAGKASLLIGSTLGAIVSGAALKAGSALGFTNMVTAASVGGTSGAIVNMRKAPLGVTFIAAASGFTAGKLAAKLFEQYGSLPSAIVGGAIGGVFASTASTLLDRGYKSLKERIASFSLQLDN